MFVRRYRLNKTMWMYWHYVNGSLEMHEEMDFSTLYKIIKYEFTMWNLFVKDSFLINNDL